MKKIIMIALLIVGLVNTVEAGSFRLSLQDKPALQQIEQTKPNRFVMENQYILLCDYLSKTNTHVSLDTSQLTQIFIDLSVTDKNLSDQLYKYLQALNNDLQLINPKWWFTSKWHTEQWAVDIATDNHNYLFNKANIQSVKASSINPKNLGVRLHINLTK